LYNSKYAFAVGCPLECMDSFNVSRGDCAISKGKSIAYWYVASFLRCYHLSHAFAVCVNCRGREMLATCRAAMRL
jgi:hypothetical protein